MEYDAVIVGSGPNGLAAGIALQQHGISVLIIEAKDTIGGGMRSAELTLPGFTHDICSAIHPMAAASPFFRTLPLESHGLEYIYPTINAAHPFDNGEAAVSANSLAETMHYLGDDANAYGSLFKPMVSEWPAIELDVLGPIGIPRKSSCLYPFWPARHSICVLDFQEIFYRLANDLAIEPPIEPPAP